MGGKYIMSLDQGTTSSRCILFDEHCRIVSSDQRELRQIYPQPGWVEQDPMEIWASQISVAFSAMERKGIVADDIHALGLTNQRETTIIWDKRTGKPIYNAIVWQCRRSAGACKQLLEQGHGKMIRNKTGLVVDAYFSATKIQWILKNVDGTMELAKAGHLLFGNVDTWLIWNLTSGKNHFTDYTNACRTMLYNIYDKCWDLELLEFFDIPKSMLPEVLPSNDSFGSCEHILKRPIPIRGVSGDQQAALFGQKCFEPGLGKNTYGTGSFLLLNTGDHPVNSAHGLITTIGTAVDGKIQYALEGSVFICGAVIQWLRDEMELLRHADDSEGYALKVPDTNGVYFVPAMTGMGAPYWRGDATGIITGLTRGSNKNHIIRAALEAMAYQSMDIVKAMEEDSGIELKSLLADGGAANNKFLMGFQADILNKPVFKPAMTESTALGAAMLAGLGSNFWKDTEELKNLNTQGDLYEPAMEENLRKNLISGWQRAVSQALYTPPIME